MTSQHQHKRRVTSTEQPAVRIANDVFAALSGTTDFAKFYAVMTNSATSLIALSVKDDVPLKLQGIALATASIIVECIGRATVAAGEGAGFPTVRSEFLQLLESSFRLFTKEAFIPEFAGWVACGDPECTECNKSQSKH